MTAPTVTPELKTLLRRVKLGRCLDTLPERLALAHTGVTSNREPIEWLALMADPLLAQSAIDRLQSAAPELVLDGESYRQRQKPGVTDDSLDPPAPARPSSRRRR